jgi:hypothetical protein
MDANIGDRLVVDGKQIGRSRHTGEIVEVLRGADDSQHYRVRWEDGHESIVFPGTDARVEHAGHGDATRPDPTGATSRTVAITLRLVEDFSHCEATAVMDSSIGEFTGTGESRRRAGDPVVPMIGEELAIARSLVDLALQLEAAARRAIDEHEQRRLHLV